MLGGSNCDYLHRATKNLAMPLDIYTKILSKYHGFSNVCKRGHTATYWQTSESRRKWKVKKVHVIPLYFPCSVQNHYSATSFVLLQSWCCVLSASVNNLHIDFSDPEGFCFNQHAGTLNCNVPN